MEDLFLKRFEKLNEKQKEAVLSVEGPIMVVAGPGTGKTELLALRVAHIIREGIASPSSLLCLTFTESACLAMRERLTKLLGENAYRVPIFTFHSFASYIMGRFPEYFFEATSFTLADDIVRAEIFENIFRTLPYSHPFSAYHPAEGYVFLKDVKERLRHIKTGGYTAQEYQLVTDSLLHEYEKVNKLFLLWPKGRLSIKRLTDFDALLEALQKEKTTVGILLYKAFKKALDEALDSGKTESISVFKKEYLVGDEEVLFLKDFYNKDKLLALAEMYTLYEKEMYKRGLYDFDDMIVLVSHALSHESFLRTSLEEEFQYIMVDEFQDTNEAQMDIVRYLTSSPLYEGKPNVLVVGDDDQAIYKFQGAEVSHLMRFREKMYKDVKTIVLDNNYRSTQEVLNLARNVVMQGKDRLENHFSDIQKILVSKNKTIKHGVLSIKKYATQNAEYTSLVNTIKKLMEEGESLGEMAVLARSHKELELLLPYLISEGIPFEYTKKSDVFEEKHIKELIILSEYLASFMEYGKIKDFLVPEILSFSFFGIERRILFELSLIVKKEHKEWLIAASESTHPALAQAASFLIEMGGYAKELPLQEFLKKLIEDSPFKTYYFSKEKLQDSPLDYVTFLTSLRTFLDAFSEYKEGKMLTAKDIEEFVLFHKVHKVTLSTQTVSVKQKESIKLMTAHAAKGLEFSIVFIVGASDKTWVKGRRGYKVPLPFPLQVLLEPVGDDVDDFLRLFYVALTRAKHSLYISASEQLLRFLPPSEKTEEVFSLQEEVSGLESTLSLFANPLVSDEKEILKKLVESYAMPVTHMQNFCNVAEGGPFYFLEQNLLRFPQPMNPSALYGSAFHKVIEEFVLYKKYNAGEIPSMERLFAFFDKELAKGRLQESEYKRQKERGHSHILAYFTKHASFFREGDVVEADFSHEGVVIDGAHITGKIDFIRKEGNTISVIDFKTGDSFSGWDEKGLTDYEKIKLHKYRQQLVVYKILLEGSKNYIAHNYHLSLSFVEDEKALPLYLDDGDVEVEKVKKLLSVVYQKIKHCDFPDTSHYEKNFKGILAFEEDLTEGKI